MSIEQPPLWKSNPFPSVTNLPREEIEPKPEVLMPPPTVQEAELAFDDVKRILRPPKKVADYKDLSLTPSFVGYLKG
ncbi:hypothetical protein K503DRAFT_869721 [Rhizopogon vinicolor AM-OR11-026]|uniref:Uncharacterized protein n=1 Tax=Rhizopogon vinicolor AM-OR11-026 TaxID=1314800 RepID=A0A1B7MKM6_9AGAM|nr:hypothetical protein K503DRAFT_869721 [Rhizopogon vinicolor AM-OR11-026]